MADLEQRVSLTDRLQIHTIELAKYNETAESLFAADNLEKWTYFLNHAAEMEVVELQSLLPDAPYRKATGIIEMISPSPEQRRLHDARVRAQRDYFSAMEGAKEEARESGLAEGRAQGLAQGLAEGRAEGKAEGRAEALRDTIRLLSKILGEVGPEDRLLDGYDLSVLQSLAAELERKLVQRNTG